MAFRFLTAGDIHLGRRPSRVPEDRDAREFAPRQAWNALVETAIAQRVDAIALSGDVVDQENRFYEALSDLQRGVQRLVSEGIPVIAVAGNHDFEVLPRLAAQLDGFHLLGQGGVWESLTVQSSTGTTVRFLGWSFPRQHVTENPLGTCPCAPDNTPMVGLLHCDCNAQTSRYAPVSLVDLQGQGTDVWALGHIHASGLIGSGRPPVFYTGSLQGLDPTEVGPHGAWVVTLETGEPPRLELQPMAALQWENLVIPLDGAATDAAVERAVTDAVRRVDQKMHTEAEQVRAVGCRLQFTGRTTMHRALPSIAARLIQDYRPSFEGISYFVEGVADQTQPDVNLEDLARSTDPAGLLAQRLLLLDHREPSDKYQDLLAEAKEAIDASLPATVFASLPAAGEPLTDDAVREVLIRSGFKALDHLLAQKEASE
jgi:DNA repair protein SbcD/Mre11